MTVLQLALFQLLKQSGRPRLQGPDKPTFVSISFLMVIISHCYLMTYKFSVFLWSLKNIRYIISEGLLCIKN